MPRTRPCKVSDQLWEQVELLIPPASSHIKGGRLRMPNRQAFEAIVYVLRTGIQWNTLLRELGGSSTVHDRFQEWEHVVVSQALWQAGVGTYDELQGIQWDWQSIDGVTTKASFGHAAICKNPTDRGKQGVNRHNMKLLCATLKRIVIARPVPSPDQPQHLCLNAGYDYPDCQVQAMTHQYVSHIRSSGQEKQAKATMLGFRARRCGWWSALTSGSITPADS
jgi:putative transposase